MSKDLRLNKIYLFNELPLAVQHDFLIQFENDLEINPSGYAFCLRRIPYKKLLEEFDSILGPNLIDEIENDYVIELAKDIEDNGLQYPPICSEGIHRSLACLYLKKDMFRFELIY